MPFDIGTFNDAAAILTRARSLLTQGWCRYDQAKDAAGRSVYPTADAAVSWCAYGALVAAGMPQNPIGDEKQPLNFLLRAIGEDDDGAAWFNNRQNIVDPILDKFDEAINLALQP